MWIIFFLFNFTRFTKSVKKKWKSDYVATVNTSQALFIYNLNWMHLTKTCEKNFSFQRGGKLLNFLSSWKACSGLISTCLHAPIGAFSNMFCFPLCFFYWTCWSQHTGMSVNAVFILVIQPSLKSLPFVTETMFHILNFKFFMLLLTSLKFVIFFRWNLFG